MRRMGLRELEEPKTNNGIREWHQQLASNFTMESNRHWHRMLLLPHREHCYGCFVACLPAADAIIRRRRKLSRKGKRMMDMSVWCWLHQRQNDMYSFVAGVYVRAHGSECEPTTVTVFDDGGGGMRRKSWEFVVRAFERKHQNVVVKYLEFRYSLSLSPTLLLCVCVSHWSSSSCHPPILFCAKTEKTKICT